MVFKDGGAREQRITMTMKRARLDPEQTWTVGHLIEA